MTEFAEGHVFTKSADAKKAGWFSRRHKTDEAHLRAKASRLKAQNEKLARAANGGTTKTFYNVNWDNMMIGDESTGVKECVKTGFMKAQGGIEWVEWQVVLKGNNPRFERLKNWLKKR